MSLVVVERSFSAPQVFAELQAVEDANVWCLDENGVKFVRTYFSLDRMRMACIYEAPDAEAARRAQRKAGLPFDRAWPVLGMYRELADLGVAPSTGEKQMVVCERTFDSPVSVEGVAAIVAENGWCLETNNVDVIDSYMRAGDTGTLCVYAAPDAESVRRASRAANLPFDRAWAATLHEPAT